jgi:hypothetical protein
MHIMEEKRGQYVCVREGAAYVAPSGPAYQSDNVNTKPGSHGLKLFRIGL